LDRTGFDLPKFIRYHWLSTTAFVSTKHLFKSIKRNTTDYRVLLDSLKASAEQLARLTQPSDEEFVSRFPKSGVAIARALRGLRLMRVTQCYVFLLALIRNADRIKPKLMLEFVQKV